MVCTRVHMLGGGTAIICSRGQRTPRCSECKAPSSKLCDYPKPTSRRPNKTCDVNLCQSCAVKITDRIPRVGEPVGDTVDLCPMHNRMVERNGWPQPEPPAPSKAKRKKRAVGEAVSPQLTLFGER